MKVTCHPLHHLPPPSRKCEIEVPRHPHHHHHLPPPSPERETEVTRHPHHHHHLGTSPLTTKTPRHHHQIFCTNNLNVLHHYLCAPTSTSSWRHTTPNQVYSKYSLLLYLIFHMKSPNVHPHHHFPGHQHLSPVHAYPSESKKKYIYKS